MKEKGRLRNESEAGIDTEREICGEKERQSETKKGERQREIDGQRRWKEEVNTNVIQNRPKSRWSCTGPSPNFF